MINKLYETIKEYIKQNYKFLIILILSFFVLTYELPYYINTPGGLLDVSDKVYISDSEDVSGSFNLAYVQEFKATIPTIIYAYFNSDWDILKYNDVVAPNENVEEIEYRNHLFLDEANQNATIVGFNKANEYYAVTNRITNVVYIDALSNTDLKIGDQILEVNGVLVKDKNHILELIQESSDLVHLKVLNNGIEYNRYAHKIDIDGYKMIGIVVCETKEVDTNREIEFKFKPSESGPSGGFMMALSIYNYLTEYDITHGLKIVGTGTIDEEGNVGSIGGIEYKIKAAFKNGADIFFVPNANYEEAKKVVIDNDLNINLINVGTIDEAIKYLNEYK